MIRPELGVDLQATFNLVGSLLKYLGLAPLLPAAIAVGYGESPWPFVASAAIVFGVAWGLERVTHGKTQVGIREGFLVVS